MTKRNLIIGGLAVVLVLGVIGAASGGTEAAPAPSVAAVATPSPTVTPNPRAAEDSLDEAAAGRNCVLFMDLLHALSVADKTRYDAYLTSMRMSDVEWAGTECVDETPEPSSAYTAGQQNAIESAQSYLNSSSFSRTGLIGQLEYEGFSKADATFAVDSLDVNWNAQAYLSAKSYLNSSSFSLKGLIEQLEYEGFTAKQAKYGATKAYNE